MSDDSHHFDSLDECVDHWMKHWNVPGIGVGVLSGGKIDLQGFGITSIDTNVPVTADTLFQIGSISKVYTTTLIMILVDQGILDLDEPVITYLPSLRLQDENALKTITLRHLVTHTSGVFGDFIDDFGMGDDALGRYVEAMAELRQIYQPSELWSYTNSGFNLAGHIIERLLDKPFEDVMRELLLQPAGLDHTFQFPHEAITYPLAVGHVHQDPLDDLSLEVARRYPLPRSSHPAGGIIATTGDVIKFAQLHLTNGVVDGEQVVSESSVKAMQSRQVQAANLAEEWGLGWLRFSLGGAQVIGHGGTTNGFQSAMRVVPEKNFAIVVLTNGDHGHAAEQPILNWAFQHYLGLHAPERQEILLEPEKVERVLGTYTQPTAEITVRNVDGVLQLDILQKRALDDSDEPKKLPPIEIKPVGELEFAVMSGLRAGTTLDFIENEDGDIRFIRFGGRLADRVTE